MFQNEIVRLALLAAVLALAAVAGANLMRPPPTAPAIGTEPAAIAQPAPLEPAPEPKRPERLNETRASGEAIPVRLSPPYDVLTGTILRSDGREVLLAGVEGPDRDAVCIGADNLFWACGLRARAALANRIRDEDLLCLPLGRDAVERIVATCAVGGSSDLASALVAEGWARPSPGWEPVFADLPERARRDGRGMWNGGWRLRQP